MTSSVRKDTEAFDFKDEDELPEFPGGKYGGRSESPNSDDNAMTKYEFLASVAQGNLISKRESDNVLSVDIGDIGCDQNHENADSHAHLPSSGENEASTDGFSRSFVPEVVMGLSSPRQSSPGKSHSRHALSDSPSSVEPPAGVSDGDKRMKEYSSSCSSVSGEDASPNGHASDDCISDSGMDDFDMAVVLSTDYVIHREKYFTELLVTFSTAGIMVHSPHAFDHQRMFKLEWNIDDIVSINTQWFQRVEQAMIIVRLLTKDVLQADQISEVDELKLAVADAGWPDKQEEILALNVKYSAIWNISNATNMAMDGDGSPAQMAYFPNFDQAFEEVVYPKGDSDAVSITKRDVDLLLPSTFLNDNIIDFYVKYLKNQIPPEDRQRFHFFNSFFFRKLADLDRDPSLAADGRAAFLRVRKWTRKVDIFGKDYIFVPVNFNLHWSLIVICHPGEVAGFKDEDKSLRVPCILHMDSIKGTHAGLKNLIQSYLWEEWKERQGEVSEDTSAKFLNLRFVPLELPQQENSFDCGLFLLHYLELFLAEAPVNFNPFKITKWSNFLNVNWFPPLEASLKRTMIQKLIFELTDHHSQEGSPAAGRDENPSEVIKNENGTGMEFLTEQPTNTMTCQENLSNYNVGHGIEITLLEASSLRNSQCVNESGVVLREFFESGASAAPLLSQFQSFENASSFYRLNGTMSQIEDDTANNEHFMFSSTDNGFGQMDGIAASQTCSVSYPCGSLGGDASYNMGISDQAGHGEMCSPPESSNSDSDSSEDVGIVEDFPVREDVVLNKKMNTDQQIKSPGKFDLCPTDGLDDGPTKTVENSALGQSHGILGTHDDCPSYQGNIIESSAQECHMPRKRLHEDSSMVESCDIACDNLQVSCGDTLPEIQMQAAKKPCLPPRPQD